MKQYIALVLALGWLATLPAVAQEEKIKADRPGLSLSPELAGKGILIAEAGLERQQQQKEAYTYQHPDLSLHFGLSQMFELRAELTVKPYPY